MLRAAALIGMLGAVATGFKIVEKVEKVEKVVLCDTWKPEIVIPLFHDKLGALLCYRHGYIRSMGDAASSLDHDYLLTNYRELIQYLPRAALLAMVVPTPRWCSFFGQCEVTSPGGGFKRLVSSVEMVFFYVIMPGWLGWLIINDEKNVRALGVGLFVFAWLVALFYVLSSPNEGTLYRQRFPETALWWFGGVIGWVWGVRSLARKKKGRSCV